MTARPRDARRAGPARRAGSGATPRPPGQSRPGRRRWPMLALVAAAALALAAWGVFRPHRVGPPDPLAGLDLHVAQDSVASLSDRGLHAESVPYLRHIEAAISEPGLKLEQVLATELNNATMQTRQRKGIAVPAMRSSIERVAYAREVFGRFGGLVEVSPTATDRSSAAAMRAQLLAVWGFMREGYVEYRRAEEIQRLPDRTRRQAGWVERLLEDPTRADIPLMSGGKLSDIDAAMSAPADSASPRHGPAPARKR